MWWLIWAVLLNVFQMQSPVGEDDDVFIGNVSLDEGLLDAEDDVKVDCSVPKKVSVPKYSSCVRVYA